jgi:hypothetical protein
MMSDEGVGSGWRERRETSRESGCNISRDGWTKETQFGLQKLRPNKIRLEHTNQDQSQRSRH